MHRAVLRRWFCWPPALFLAGVRLEKQKPEMVSVSLLKVHLTVVEEVLG